MEEIYRYYQENIEAYTRRSAYYAKRIYWLGSVRLALVLLMLLTLWFLRAEDWVCLTAVVVAYAVPFALLMVWHNKLYALKLRAEALARLNSAELKGLDYDFSAFDGAAEKIDASHSFSLDLDLFGERSLFQSINRTVTALGRERLADWFLHPLTDKRQILDRQEAVREMSALSALRQSFYVTGVLRRGSAWLRSRRRTRCPRLAVLRRQKSPRRHFSCGPLRFRPACP